jgi:AraC family transcriptional regulator
LQLRAGLIRRLLQPHCGSLPEPGKICHVVSRHKVCGTKRGTMTGLYEKRLLRVVEHIYTHPADDLSLDALADVAAMSRFHWHRVFHAMTGETVAEAVRRLRMHRAAFWLVTESWPLTEVAHRPGYPNPRSFARAFEARHGLTHARFRQRGMLLSPLQRTAKGTPAMFEVTIRNEPARRLAAIAHRGPYPEIGKSFEKLRIIVAARNLTDQIEEMAGVYYDDPAAVAAADLRSHAGFVLPKTAMIPEGLDEVLLPAGRVAALRFRGHYSSIKSGYDYLFGPWLAASREEPRDAPAMEIYLNTPMDTAPEDLLTDICLPIR